MDKFGQRWKDHAERIARAWQQTVGPGDLVLIPGDHSWAMKLEQARDDLDFIGQLPGRKVMIRGNHDYWWQSIGKVRKALPEGVYAVQNDFVHFDGNWAICGTRGWLIPSHPDFGQEDEKLLAREASRLELSLQSAEKAGLVPEIVMIHYPPLPHSGEETVFSDLLEAYGVRLCVYGHLHGDAGRYRVDGTYRGVQYVLVACDAIDFAPKLVGAVDSDGKLQLAR